MVKVKVKVKVIVGIQAQFLNHFNLCGGEDYVLYTNCDHDMETLLKPAEVIGRDSLPQDGFL